MLIFNFLVVPVCETILIDKGQCTNMYSLNTVYAGVYRKMGQSLWEIKLKDFSGICSTGYRYSIPATTDIGILAFTEIFVIFG